jgi:hypothetical protein
MHLIGMDRNILGCSAVVGSHIPIAVGYALVIRRRRENRVARAEPRSCRSRGLYECLCRLTLLEPQRATVS